MGNERLLVATNNTDRGVHPLKANYAFPFFQISHLYFENLSEFIRKFSQFSPFQKKIQFYPPKFLGLGHFPRTFAPKKNVNNFS